VRRFDWFSFALLYSLDSLQYCENSYTHTRVGESVSRAFDYTVLFSKHRCGSSSSLTNLGGFEVNKCKTRATRAVKSSESRRFAKSKKTNNKRVYNRARTTNANHDGKEAAVFSKNPSTAASRPHYTDNL